MSQTITVEIEPAYDFLADDAGGLMLVLNARQDKPESASLVLAADGHEAVLMRGNNLAVRLTRMHPDTPARLRAASEVSVVEMAGNDIAHAYRVKVMFEL